MSRISEVSAEAAQQGRKLLIPYVVAGDPDLPTTLKLLHKLVADGADMIELGVPFSDPSSDGLSFSAVSSVRSLGALILLRCLISLLNFDFRTVPAPIVLMGYLNPVEIMGYEAFARVQAMRASMAF